MHRPSPPTGQRRSIWPPTTRKWQRSFVVMRKSDVAVLVVASCLAFGCRATCVDTAQTRRMFEAAWRNDVAGMQDLLDRDASLVGASACAPVATGARPVVAARMGGMTTPLLVAARNGHAEIVRLLIAHGAPPDSANAMGETALYLAAEYGHDDVIKALIAAHASVDARAKGNLTPLDVATMYGRFGAVKLLLAAGADANREMEGYGALHSAAAGGHGDVVRLLIQHGARI